MDNQIFNSLIISIFVDAGIEYFTINRHCFLLIMLLAAGDIDYILIAKRNIRNRTFQDTANVDTQHLQCAVCFHAMHHSVLRDCPFFKSCCGLYQSLHGTDISADMIHTRTEHSALDLHHILIAVQRRIHTDRILVHQFEIIQVELADAEYRILLSSLTIHADSLRIGITRKSARITE